MATIDDKVVAISFESSRFEQGVNRTISSLEKLKAALHFPTAGKGLTDINKAAQSVDLSHISRGVDGVKKALESLRLVAIGVMSQLATQALRFAGTFVKSFTLDPIKQGFAEYSTNLNAIQTILANTQAAGTNLKQVNAALKELNEYSDKTIYNFSQMAKNIGTFTAAGVGLKTATASIKGIANLAALSGSNSEQASTAMYQLSQAISAGSVKLMDWNSVVNAGMGGTVFQRALAMNAEKMGQLKKGAVDLVGPMKNVTINGEAFRQSLSTPGKASWLTSKVLTQTLQQFTGDLSDAQLAAQGFNDAEIKAIQQTAKTAMHAATEVKTVAQVFDVAKETMGSGWAETFQIIFGTFTEAKTTFTAMSNAINGFINKNADARNKVLADWKALGGRTVLIDGIKTAFHNLGLILAPIKEAFRDIFPATTGKNLFDLTLKFKSFAEALKPSEKTVDGLKRTFRGLFALLDIGKQIIGGILTVFGKLFGAVGDGSGGFLEVTGSIGDFIVKIDEALKKGDGLHKFFAGLGTILALPIKLLGKLADLLGDLFSGFSSGGISKQIDGMNKSMTPLGKIMEGLSKAWDKLITSLTSGKLQSAIQAIISLIVGLGQAIGEAASNINFEAILAVIRTGLLGGLLLLFKNFFGKGSLLDQISKGFGKGIIANISGSFKALEGSMTAIQQNLKAKTLKEIAIAIALLTASVVALSFIDPKKLNNAIVAVGFMLGELLGAMALIDKIAATGGFVKLPIIAAGLILLAGAIDILTIAVFALSKLSWNELIKGLTGVGALLGGLVLAVKPLSAGSAGLVRASVGLIAIAVALNIMALAVKQMASLDLGALAKGLGGVGVSLGILVAATGKIPKGGMIGIGVGLMAVATALLIISKAVAAFGDMNLSTMAKGLGGIAATLVIMGFAMRLMPKNMIITGSGLIVVAGAMNLISKALANMGGMSIGQIAKGLITLALALTILGIAMSAMSSMIAGAAALTIAAAGISVLAGAIKTLGSMSWGQVLKGLITLAAALTIIGVAGALITPVIPSLLGLGAALLLIGAGLALAGAGIFLISTGLSALVVALPTGLGVILAAFTSLIKGLIENAKLLVLGVLEVVRAIAATAPQFVDAIIKIVNSLLDGFIQIAPKLEEAINALITLILNVFETNTPRIIDAGFKFIIAFLEGIKQNVPTIITLIYEIIGKIVVAILGRLPAILAAGVRLIGDFIRGILTRVGELPALGLRFIINLVTGITGGLPRIVTTAITVLTRFITAIAGAVGRLVASGVSFITRLVQGITSAIPRVATAALTTTARFISSIASGFSKLASEGAKAIGKLVRGITGALGTAAGTVKTAAATVGRALIDGISGGITDKAQALYDKVKGVMDKVVGLFHKIPGVHSPSTVTTRIGEEMANGLAVGMDKGQWRVYTAAESMSQRVIDTVNKVFQAGGQPSKTMIAIGKFVVMGFAQGLRGAPEEITKVFNDLDKKLKDAMSTSRKIIENETKKIVELRKTGDVNTEAMQKAQKVINENEILLRRTTEAHKLLVSGLVVQKRELMSVAKEYKTVSEQLKAAQQALIDLQKTREENIKTFTTKYSTLPELVTKDSEGNAVNALATYMDALKHQADAVAIYSDTLEQLRALGLDDETYQKLLEEGTADQEFATQLLAGGKTAVEGLNKLDLQLKTASTTLATNAAKNLYESGKKAALGLIDGLKSQKARLIKEMEDMADDIVRAFNRRLKVKSPSEVFAEIGGHMMAGLAKGLSDSTKLVSNAIDTAGDVAISAMKKTVRNISDLVSNELNPNPVITPILDLTQVRSQAEELGALTRVTPITAAASYGQASLISSEQLAAQGDQVAAAPGGTSVKFEQNNYSPESLTEIEIYRQTKNQLSQIKSALALT